MLSLSNNGRDNGNVRRLDSGALTLSMQKLHKLSIYGKLSTGAHQLMYRIQQAINGQWQTLGGVHLKRIADIRILQFMGCSSTKKPRFYRIRRVD